MSGDTVNMSAAAYTDSSMADGFGIDRARRFSLGFISRIAAVLIGGVIVASYTWFRVLTPVSLEGVVNAPLVTLRAPIDGVMRTASVTAGEAVVATDTLFRVHDDRIDERPRIELAGRVLAATNRKASVHESIQRLGALGQQLQDRERSYAAAQEEVLVAAAASADAAILGAAGALVNAQAQEGRARSLLASGSAPKSRLDDAVAARLASEAALGKASADRLNVIAQLKAGRAGIYLQSGFGGSTYSQQRLDEVMVRQIELRHQAVDADSEIAGLESQLDAENARLASQRDVAVPAGASGQVASVYVAAGTHVLRGNPLADVLDCGNLYIEANVAVGWFARPRAGSKVTVAVYDEKMRLHGVVRALRDSGLALDPARAIPVADRKGQRELTLLVDIDPADRDEVNRHGCPVGRPATVVFN